MLGGLAPILIYSISPGNPVSSLFSGIPLLGDTISGLGIPIPIYLDERFTKLQVESDSYQADVATETTVTKDVFLSTKYDQRVLESSVSVELHGEKNSLILQAIIALTDLILTKVVDRNYSISYLNGPTVLLGGLLKSFSVQQGSDDTLIRIKIDLIKKASPVPGIGVASESLDSPFIAGDTAGPTNIA